MRVTLWLVALTLATALVVGCGRVPVRGVITSMNHRPGWTQYVPIAQSDGTMTVVPIFWPEQWDVVVQADGTDGETGRFLVVVNRRDWERMQVGGKWEKLP